MTPDDWSRPPDETDVLPEPLRRDALRRRKLVRVGGVVVTALVLAIVLFVDVVAFLGKAWMYGSAWEWMR